MELNGAQVIPQSRERVWAALMSPAILQAAIPGCEAIEDQGQGVFAVTVMAAVGPVKARFKGRLQQLDLQAPTRYTLSFEGNGGMAGFAKGSAEVDLEAVSENETKLVYRTQAEIGGRLAQIGSRLVDAAAAHMSKQFFERLVQAMQAPAPEAAVAASVATADAAPVAAPIPTATPVAVAAPVAVGGAGLGSVVSVQMPAWTWAFTVSVIALLAAYLGTH
ncbi:MAG: carbon monoxide dehydrogenase subunit G [Aquabacterium sp.]|jgi:carbon monoxide dehydrogenase subunit G|uniref:CoxG family protein n=1 Tax=Aquabacterium sp. TaxID=1872578 RepID=UPI002A35D140|nr:carbon monoxide dehydrogenase subunit G [Aquabacterium sp.]MDX9842459.1 carbon monoxide dehydrogenase subunit G [Aquabacterium sp.]